MVAVIALVLWLLPSVVQATTYYVSTTGSDANNGLSEETPFLTVKKGTDTMAGGDTVLVRGGTYTEQHIVRIRYSGSPSSPTKLAAYPGELPIINFVDGITGNTERVLLIQQNAGSSQEIAYVNIEGLEIKNAYNGIRWYNCRGCLIKNNHVHTVRNSPVLGTGGVDTVIEKNILADSGQVSQGGHGVYLTGSNYVIRRNLIYNVYSYGIQLKGNQNPDPSRHPSVEFSDTVNAVIQHNLIAYENDSAGIVIWGSRDDNAKIENNIFYENDADGGSVNGINCVSCSGSTGIAIRNNIFYATGSGGTGAISSGLVDGVNYTQSGNLINGTNPGFVNGGSNALPASPDWRLSAHNGPAVDAGVDVGLPYNGSAPDIGPWEVSPSPAATIQGNTITLIYPVSLNVPIKNISTTGLTVGCTGSSCPGSPSINSASPASNTDTHILVPIDGIVGNACVSTNQNWTISYNSTSGTWTTNDNIGPYPGINQKLFSFTSLPVTNQCTGTGPASYPSGYHIYYKFDEGTGINANDESANGLDCTLTNGATWGTGRTGSGMAVAAGSTQHCTVPWGSGVDPTTQSLTVFVPVNIAAGAENAVHYVVGPDHGTNQRLYICARNGTWRVSIQSTTCSAQAASNLAVTAGWNALTLRMDSTIDTFTLYKDGVVGTGGATGSYTSFTFATNWTLGRVSTLSSTGGTYDDFLIYLSLQDPIDLIAAFNTSPPPPVGTLKQDAIQFQGVVLDQSGNPIVIGPAVKTISVPKGGGVVLLFQVLCQSGADCAQTAFKLVAAKNGSGVWQQLTSTNVFGTWMWGVTTEPNLNSSARSTRLEGSCTVTTGSTQLTADQVPSLAIPQTGCTVLGYIVHVDGVAGVDYYDYKLLTEAGLDLAGGYDEIARIRVVNPMGGGVGY